MLARRAGQGSRAGVGAAFAVGLRLMLAACLVVFLLVRLAGPFVTDFLVSTDAVRTATDAFLRVIVLGVGFEALGLLLGAFYVGIGRPQPSSPSEG